ncbi:MAG: hypothetical protein AB7Y46_12945 [Armatimonadota bacterium]
MRHVLLLLGTAAVAVAEPIAIETTAFRLQVDEQGRLISLTAAGSQAELGRPGEPIAQAMADGVTVAVSAARPADGGVELSFGDSGISATLAWEQHEGLALIELTAVVGEPERLDFLSLPLAEGGVLFAQAHAVRGPSGFAVAMVPEVQECWVHGDGSPRLMASVAREVSLGPVRMALMVALEAEVGDRIQQAEELFGIPLGMKAKRSDAARGSYLMISGVTAENVDEVIDWARRGGFGSILLLHGTWGHFGRRYAVPESTFPAGVEQLREVVDRMHAAGLLVGAHMFSSKLPKQSAWTEAGVVDKLWEDRSLTLAQAMTPQSDRIVTTEPPADWPVTTGTRDIRINGELMTYTDLSLAEPFGFTGVSRAAYGTTAQAHEAGSEVAHVLTDESRGIFIIDQTTDLLEAHTADIARTYNAAGFDWIYFDGAEDVHEPRWWTTSNAQMAVIEKLEREPAIVQMAAGSPFSWHLTTRTGQRDYFWVSMSYKDEVDDAVARSWPRAREALAVADFGWFPLRAPSEHVRGTQIDDVEYLCAKALATDSAYSIQTSVSRMRDVPSLDAILHVMGRWEHHKFAGTFGDEVKQRLLTPHQDFMLIEREGVEPRVVAAREMPYVGGTSHLVRAFVGEPLEGVTPVSLAPVDLPATIEFSLDPRRLQFTDFQGEPAQVEVLPGARVVVPVTTRLFMYCEGIPTGELRMALRGARCQVIKPQMVFIDAGRPVRIEGSFTTGAAAGVDLSGACGDGLVPSGPLSPETGPGTWAEYEVDVPEGGRWYLWIRARYADTNSNSFFLWDPEHPEKPIRLGNLIGTYHEWLWDGPVPLELPAGPAVLRITGRESRPLESPLLDLLCLVRGQGRYRPTDGDARAALAESAPAEP